MPKVTITRRSQIAAIVPAAGLGTRLRPYTRALPKELMPFGRRTILDWVAAELVEVGIRAMYLVVSEQKLPLFRAHIQAAPHGRGEDEKTAALWAKLHVTFVIQRSAAGLGDAVAVGISAAQEAGHLAPVAVLLPDELHRDGLTLANLIATHDRYQGSVLSTFRAAEKELHRFGVLKVNQAAHKGGPHQVTSALEKPEPRLAPSRFAISGRYLLDESVIEILTHTTSPRHGELQLTDAIATAAEQGSLVWAQKLQTPRIDLGDWDSYEAETARYLRRGPTQG